MHSPFIMMFSEIRIIHIVWGPATWGLLFYYFLTKFSPP